MNITVSKPTAVNLPDELQLSEFISQYRQVMMLYESAIQCVSSRLDIISKESKIYNRRTPIRAVTSRLKEPQSIYRKLRQRGYPLTLESIKENLNDVAGIRVICEYICDAYTIRDALLVGGIIKPIQEKDYIKEPKPNGYRSLHLIVDVPVLLSEGERHVRCEIQIRTTAMDSWAALEHNLRYKKNLANDEKTDRKLKLCASMLAESDSMMQDIAEDLGFFRQPDGQRLLK